MQLAVPEPSSRWRLAAARRSPPDRSSTASSSSQRRSGSCSWWSPAKSRGCRRARRTRGLSSERPGKADGEGPSLSALATSAQDADVHTIETFVEVRVLPRRPERLLYEKAGDADWLRAPLKKRGSQLGHTFNGSRRCRTPPNWEDIPGLGRTMDTSQPRGVCQSTLQSDVRVPWLRGSH